MVFLCATLASEGCHLVLLSRDKKLEKATNKIKKIYKIKCLTIQGDVANPNVPKRSID